MKQINKVMWSIYLTRILIVFVKLELQGFCFCKKNLFFFCFPLEENQIKNIFLLPLNYCAALSRVSWFLFLPNTSSWQIGASTERLSHYSIKMAKTRPICYCREWEDNWTNSFFMEHHLHAITQRMQCSTLLNDYNLFNFQKTNIRTVKPWHKSWLLISRHILCI